ncbi:MAG TPA: hypothetical protein VFR31_03820, partial [Thermoanaerobaculia bacterium]|nr:hypothetical protein [Thermoanaerobaculia bacterium]
SVLFFMAVGVTNPFALAAALVGAGAFATALRRGAINEQAKREIARALGEKFRAELTSTSEKLAEEIHVETEVFVKSAEQGLNREILVLREQVDGVLQAKKAGEVQVQAKRRSLGELEAELSEIDASVKELIFGVAESR